MTVRKTLYRGIHQVSNFRRGRERKKASYRNDRAMNFVLRCPESRMRCLTPMFSSGKQNAKVVNTKKESIHVRNDSANPPQPTGGIRRTRTASPLSRILGC